MWQASCARCASVVSRSSQEFSPGAWIDWIKITRAPNLVNDVGARAEQGRVLRCRPWIATGPRHDGRHRRVARIPARRRGRVVRVDARARAVVVRSTDELARHFPSRSLCVRLVTCVARRRKRRVDPRRRARRRQRRERLRFGERRERRIDHRDATLLQHGPRILRARRQALRRERCRVSFARRESKSLRLEFRGGPREERRERRAHLRRNELRTNLGGARVDRAERSHREQRGADHHGAIDDERHGRRAATPTRRRSRTSLRIRGSRRHRRGRRSTNICSSTSRTNGARAAAPHGAIRT